MGTIKVRKEGVLLQKTDLAFENVGVLNPGVIKEGQHIHLFYRAVRKGNFSSIGYCRLSSPLVIEERRDIPIMSPEYNFEIHGMEDPRIVKIDGLYYLTYTAYDGVNALGALATSLNLTKWHKHGIIVPQITYDEFKTLLETKAHLNVKYSRYNIDMTEKPHTDGNAMVWDKNLIFFPRRIHHRLYFLHRIRPDVQLLIGINSLEELNEQFWKNYLTRFEENVLLTPKYAHEVSYIGGGCPPIETSEGWLLIYHGVHDTIAGYTYCCCAALLDLDDPQQEIGRLPYPLFFPEEEYERMGQVSNVCFPTGAVVEGDMLYIYYGAADERIAVASVSITALLFELQHTETKKSHISTQHSPNHYEN
ncbi:hypothetical protein [Sphingobacterium sp. SYP-B4668]|uniref:glycoside hydrolase family 130 protein n=1 Tax=Sphingobacterium sp. SYP-B4668 TaxID=2996035 RepID=UPI0022DDD9A1|nr:hypothetical protein [Sphingobacterium sp. SYP-B4668]